jgi:ligand-binding SRPBCC domain-containing protein
MYQLKRQQLVRTDIASCWNFFSSPDNLARITPGYMRFRVLTDQKMLPANKAGTIYEGLIIAYTVSPILGIPLGWVTEITTVAEERFFVDEQRKGPYRLWHHEHHFEAVEGGVLMTDIVSYILPLGILGRLAHWLFVRKQLEDVFDYRKKIVEELFAKNVAE